MPLLRWDIFLFRISFYFFVTVETRNAECVAKADLLPVFFFFFNVLFFYGF